MVGKSSNFLLFLLVSVASCSQDRSKESSSPNQGDGMVTNDAPEAGASSLSLSTAALTERMERGRNGDKNAAFAVHRHFAFTTENNEQADQWLQISAELKHPSAMFNLGYQLVHTPGREREGLELIKSSATHGNVTAIRYLEKNDAVEGGGVIEGD